MSSRRSRSRETGVSRRITDDEIQELVSKLHQLLPQLENGRRNDKVSARRLVEETCNYIRSLHREVDDLSERLSQLLLQNTTSIDTSQVALLRTLLFQ